MDAATRPPSSYRELAAPFEFFNLYHVAPFDDAAAARFAPLRRLRVGTMDLKTATIALTHDALLLTANRRDFERVPGLRFENRLD